MTSSSSSNEIVIGSSDSSEDNIKVLGVCGGIGSGKSTACKILVEKIGCLFHLDADKVGHSIYSPGSQAMKDIVKEFGSGILREKDDAATDDDGVEEEIDRKKLGQIVFADPNEMSKLERIVWPHMKEKLKDKIKEIKKQNEESSNNNNNNDTMKIIILEAAILLDAGWDDIVDGVWVVTAPKDVAIDRLIETRGLTREESIKRYEAQTSRRGIGNLNDEIQKGTVTDIIENAGSNLSDLEKTLRNKINKFSKVHGEKK